MIINRPSIKPYNLCIFGSGPAGIITALEFARLNPAKRILIVEFGSGISGGANTLDDSIKLSNTVNHHGPYECTNKGLGGSSASWGGRCVMYDEIDFLERDVIGKDCTWDLDVLSDVSGFLPQAADYFECGQPSFDLGQIPDFKNNRIAEGFQQGPVTDTAVERWSMPTRFGKRYRDQLSRSGQIEVLEGFELRDFCDPDQTGQIASANLKNAISQETISIKAHYFVIAAGAQETTRILLRNTQLFARLAQVPDALGHYYQGHISGKIATVQFSGDPKKTDYGFQRQGGQTYIRRRFQFTTESLKKNNLLNTAIWLDNPLYYNPGHRSGAMSFMYLAMIMPILGKKLAPPAITESITKGKTQAVSGHLINILRDLPGSLLTPAILFYKRYVRKRKLPGVFLYNPHNRYALHFHAEQKPDYKNRMYLAADNETLIIDYSIGDDDINSVIKSHELLDHWLQACGCGKLHYWYEKPALYKAIKSSSKDGIHQSGTTRMADSEQDGVVDRALKLFGSTNLFICSSSVFPTSGQANPTFLLGAFAARLAHHLTSL